MENREFGYARVSSKEQNLDRQLEALKEFGISERDIYYDKQSGKDFDRPQYVLLADKILREGDVFVVKSIDRMGRNYDEILSEWKKITKEIKADIVVLDMPLLDTRQNKDLLGTLIADIVLQLLSYVAQSERENIRQRQLEGIAVARMKGKHLGRPYLKLPNWQEEIEKVLAGEITPKECREKLGIAKSTYYAYLKRHKEQN